MAAPPPSLPPKPPASAPAGGAALEAQQALALWHRVLVDGLNRALPDLTTRQFALFLEVYLAPPPHTVRGLAQTLNMSKPAVTRAVDRLEKLEFVRRKADERDKRSILVQRSVKGSVFLREFADMAAAAARGLAG
ncbi:MAG: MarR family transcriptional regulator [Bacteroidota bacterium]|nr:MarR family transcriptional regulator [Kiloniellaceae bacterium]